MAARCGAQLHASVGSAGAGPCQVVIPGGAGGAPGAVAATSAGGTAGALAAGGTAGAARPAAASVARAPVERRASSRRGIGPRRQD
ncbi:MAG: hypothetical protein WKG00_41760, partial [Polyangiaceae bacterium]